MPAQSSERTSPLCHIPCLSPWPDLFKPKCDPILNSLFNPYRIPGQKQTLWASQITLVKQPRRPCQSGSWPISSAHTLPRRRKQHWLKRLGWTKSKSRTGLPTTARGSTNKLWKWRLRRAKTTITSEMSWNLSFRSILSFLVAKKRLKNDYYGLLEQQQWQLRWPSLRLGARERLQRQSSKWLSR